MGNISSKKSPTKLSAQISSQLSAQLSSQFSTRRNAAADQEPRDIIDLILEDHKPLKKLIKILKETSSDLSKRQKAFDEFAPLLIMHAKPEELILYVDMKQENKLRTEGFEGDVEHILAEQMLDEANNTSDEDLWSARVKVLAEIVEHHIKEEENILLPKFKKYSTKADRVDLGARFLEAKKNTLPDGNERDPRKTIDENSIISAALN